VTSQTQDEELYELDLLIPTARFVFSVEGERVDVLPEHRSPEASAAYARLRAERPVVGMTTFPNTVLLRGPRTVLVDPGLQLQNEPVLGALAARGLGPADLDMVVLTHAHDDHADALVDFPLDLPVVLHGLEAGGRHWAAVSGVLEQHRLQFLEGEEGEIAPGLRWALTPAHTAGSIALSCRTAAGVTVCCGDTIGPQKEPFLAMDPGEGEEAAALLAAWRRIRGFAPDLVVAGHLPPFAL
jgi:glyoxylase-like metal-dependent hydrolase (beta-lactamase superfamily II)